MKILYVMLSLLLLCPVLSANQSKEAQGRLEAYNKLRNVMRMVEERYVDELTFNEIVNKAIDGMLSNLDAHSAYLDTKKFDDLKIQTSGEFGGIGITIGLKDGALTIISPIDGTPGEKAGLKSGDIILKINDQSTIEMAIDDAVGLMRGEVGSKVQLTIVRKNESKPLVFNIARDIIKVEAVRVKRIENSDLLYVRVSSFNRNVAARIQSELKKAKWAKGVVLDLRSNPGGLLNQAVEISDIFLSEGIIVSQKGRDKNENIEFKASANSAYEDIPVVVLINGGSASASEIVAGALQDHKRAIVIGEKSFGKGSVQVILPLDEGEGLRLTIARYYLPSGRTIQALGVTPDIIVYPGKVPREDDDFRLKESDLKQHLEGELEKISPQTKNTTNSTDKKDLISTDMLFDDIQLKTAIDVLKTWSIIKTSGAQAPNNQQARK